MLGGEDNDGDHEAHDGDHEAHDGGDDAQPNGTAIHQRSIVGGADTGKVANKLKFRIRIFEIFD